MPWIRNGLLMQINKAAEQGYMKNIKKYTVYMVMILIVTYNERTPNTLFYETEL